MPQPVTRPRASRVTASRRRRCGPRAAAEQLLNSGHVDEGTEVLRRVLPVVGLEGPSSPAAALFWLIVYRIWGALLGARYQGRSAGSVPPEERARIDAVYAVAMGFSIVDVILGACMQARHVVMALRGGTRHQALRALSLDTAAFERTARDWAALGKSFLLHVQFIRGFVQSVRGIAAAAAAAETPGRRG